MPLPAHGRRYGDEPDDTRAVTLIVEPRRADALPVELQQQGVVMGPSFFGVGIVVACQTPLLPKGHATDRVVSLPIGFADDAVKRMSTERTSRLDDRLSSLGTSRVEADGRISAARNHL